MQLAGGSRPQHFGRECLFVREARVLCDVGRGGGQRIGLGACVSVCVCVTQVFSSSAASVEERFFAHRYLQPDLQLHAKRTFWKFANKEM